MAIKKITRYIDDEGFTYTFEPVDGSLKIEKTKTGYEARYLVQDDNPMAPDEWGNDDLFLVAYHDRFYVESKLIDKQQARNLLKPDNELEDYEKDFVKEWKAKFHIFGLEAYIHSGVMLALGQEGNFPDRQWDVSRLGLVFVAKAYWQNYSQAKTAAKSLVDEWNKYLSGDVYGCVKETYDKKKVQIDQDSCWGFYGYDHALERLKSGDY